MSIRSFRDLDVWNVAIQLIERCYAVTRRFPRDEVFGITSQIRRSAVSIAANIAEGHARIYVREYVRHIAVAKGSANELQILLLIALRLKYVAEADYAELSKLQERVAQMLSVLLRRIEARGSVSARAPDQELPAPNPQPPAPVTMLGD